MKLESDARLLLLPLGNIDKNRYTWSNILVMMQCSAYWRTKDMLYLELIHGNKSFTFRYSQ